jgi:hypothetical protein
MINLYDRMVMDATPSQTSKEVKYFKHLGELTVDRTQVMILFRMVPKQPLSCLVVGPKFLSTIHQSDIIKAVESIDGQKSFELGNYLGTRKFSDGTEMLSYLHVENFIKKMPTQDITVVYGPGNDGRIQLDKLNEMIAKDLNLSLEQLSIKDGPKPPKNKKDNAKETAKN